MTKFPWLIAQHLHGNAVALQGVEGGVWGGGEGWVGGRAKGWKRETAPVIYDAMNKTWTKCIQDDATRAANTQVIFEELKIFYDAMTPRCDLRAGPPNSGEAYPSRNDTFLVARFRSCTFPIACSAFRYGSRVMRASWDNFIITPCIVEESTACISIFPTHSLSDILIRLWDFSRKSWPLYCNVIRHWDWDKMCEKMNDWDDNDKWSRLTS